MTSGVAKQSVADEIRQNLISFFLQLLPVSRTLTSNGARDLAHTFNKTDLLLWAKNRARKKASVHTKAGKHEPHLTPSLLSSTSPHKLVFWFPDSWQVASVCNSKTFQQEHLFGYYHKPACIPTPLPSASPSPPSVSYPSLSLSLSLSFLSHVHLYVWGKGVEMVGDGAAGGLFRDPQSERYISHMTN